MKSVSVVGTVGLPACYGGFESLVENLVRYRSEGIQYQVFCSKLAYKDRPKQLDGVKLTYIPLNANGPQSIPYDILSLVLCLKSKPDVVLILGVSGCLFLPIFKLFSKSKVVTNIDGLEWKRDKWGKWARKFLKWSESLAVKYSDVVVADNQAIGDYVMQEYGNENKIIAYGGDHALRDISAASINEDYALGLCRIEPENNVELILEAFSKANRKLKFVGNWKNSEFGKRLKSTYGNHENIELLDPVYDLDKLYQIRRNSSIYIHGHSAGGTNPSLVEMMHFGIPIVAFDCNFNRYSTEDKAIYFSNVESLVSVVEQPINLQLTTSGDSMKEIARRKYTWEKIASDYESIYFD
ncbi:MAG: glycosyltransferase family 1 protein [Algicola sp.]|nr:glycosyltransferase family 1 protein [Algicola sp.]